MEADSRRREQARHVVTCCTTVLFVAKPASHTWAEKASKDLWQQGNQCFPVLGVSIIHRGSLLGQYLESMDEAPGISLLSESKADKILMTCQALNQSLHHTQNKAAGVCHVP